MGTVLQEKAEDIAGALKPVTRYFRQRGMKVGMDTFAPYLAYFAGQDMKLLASMADFIKPMMYRITNAPAGMPFETDCLIRETVQGNGMQMEGDAKTRARNAFLKYWGAMTLEQGHLTLILQPGSLHIWPAWACRYTVGLR